MALLLTAIYYLQVQMEQLQQVPQQLQQLLQQQQQQEQVLQQLQQLHLQQLLQKHQVPQGATGAVAAAQLGNILGAGANLNGADGGNEAAADNEAVEQPTAALMARILAM